ncbi:MAG: DUF3094 family protein [Pseudomonadales bacterium]|nr:DUF3094 family protein [Pseudomonadales bacterium]
MDKQRQLTEEDQDRVKEYLNSPIHQTERPPFRPLYFTLLSLGSVTFLLVLAMILVKMTGINS